MCRTGLCALAAEFARNVPFAAAAARISISIDRFRNLAISFPDTNTPDM